MRPVSVGNFAAWPERAAIVAWTPRSKLYEPAARIRFECGSSLASELPQDFSHIEFAQALVLPIGVSGFGLFIARNKAL